MLNDITQSPVVDSGCGGLDEATGLFNTHHKMTGYDLSRGFIEWAFENPSKIRPIHYAIYFFAIEHCNRLGWKEEFGLPSYMAMEAIGVKKHHTFNDALNELVEFGFIEMVQRSKNQYTANIIRISAVPKNGKALGKARSKHEAEHGHSTVTIDKQVNNKTEKQIDGYIPTWEEWKNRWEEKGKDVNSGHCLQAFDYWESQNWMRNGKPIQNWKLALVNNPKFVDCPKAQMDIYSEFCKANPPSDWLEEMMRSKWPKTEAEEAWRNDLYRRKDYYYPTQSPAS